MTSQFPFKLDPEYSQPGFELSQAPDGKASAKWVLKEGGTTLSSIEINPLFDSNGALISAAMSWTENIPQLSIEPVLSACEAVILSVFSDSQLKKLTHIGKADDYKDLQFCRALGFKLEGTTREIDPVSGKTTSSWVSSRLKTDKVPQIGMPLSASVIEGSRPSHLVAQFHQVYDLPNVVLSGQPSTVDYERVEMRMSLIKEEFAELCGAVYGPKAEQALLDLFTHLPDEHHRDVIESADALADLIYVIYGMGLESGIDLDLVLSEVHRSNLSKLMPDGSVKRREDGKVLKGPNFSEPNIAETLQLN